MVNARVIPRFLELLTMHAHVELQLEAAWVITNIASGDTDHTAAVVEAGAVPLLKQLLSQSEGELLIQVISYSSRSLQPQPQPQPPLPAPLPTLTLSPPHPHPRPYPRPRFHPYPHPHPFTLS